MISDAVIGELLGSLIATRFSGEIAYWNAGAERLYGYSADEATGRSIFDLVVPADDGGEMADLLRSAARSGTVATESIRRTKDGRRIVVEVVVRAFRPATDHVDLMLINDRDVGSLRKAGETQMLQTRFRAVLDAAPDAMMLVDPDGRILLANASTTRLFGYARDALVGQNVDILVPARFRAPHAGHRAHYFADPRPRPMGSGLQLWGRRQDGSEFPVEISLGPVETEDGILVTAAVRDVSERKRLEDARRRAEELEVHTAQEASRLKSEFLANMSHELRTPLNAVIGFAEMMYDGKAGAVSALQQEFLGDILTSSRHLLQLINDVLDLSKVEAGKMDFRPERIELSALIGEARDILRALASEKQIEVAIDVDRQLDTVVIDPRKLKQVLYNYLSNALKFTPDNGRVVISATPVGTEEFRLQVEDTGIGIGPDDMPKLFVEFQQLDSGAAKKYPGTGLGLALTRRIVEAQGGSVGARSVVGRGSIFHAVLPRVAAQPPR